MFNTLKKVTVQMIAGANIATCIVMFLVGFSDYINPATHPYLACIGLSFPLFLIINFLFVIFWMIFHPGKLWIPMLGYLVCIVSIRTYFPINWRSDPPKSAIKILSYNVLSFAPLTVDGDGHYPILEYIKHSDADIVCLQEAAMLEVKKNIVDSVLNKYKYNDTILILNKGCYNELAIYSRFPILSREKIKYLSTGNGSVAYKLNINGDTVVVINNHLESNKLSLHDRAQYKNMIRGIEKRDTVKVESRKLIEKLGEAVKIRCLQADAVGAYIRKHQQYSIILCGDFNDNPISYTHRIIAKDLKDCYVRSGSGPGLSYNQNGFNVRIDNILCSSDWKSYNCRVDSKIDASDHYPIFCWLKKR
jgi:endonuclease/exonuclease/phosphatase family metal-dependent hydrolase